MNVTLTKCNVVIAFDDVAQTMTGSIAGAQMMPDPIEYANVGIVKQAVVDVNELHQLLGQQGEDITRATATHNGWKVKNKFTSCKYCILGKS